VGQVLDGRYRITKKLGEGGMGEVYAAEHVHIEKRFAIKLLKAEIVSNAEAVTRFRQEARSSSSIGHRNIIAIEDFGQLGDGRIYMCMELLNGAALNDLLQRPIGADRLLNILIQTGHGLAAAHAKGIVHRDMKPENIFVTIDQNGQDVPKLLDFGIAKVSGNDGQNHLTRTGTIFGTPFYMAPEQALGNPVDARTDIYAVGVIMYECFAGSLPFQGESFMGILTQHITTEPEPVAQRAAKAGRALPIGLAEIIARCMQKNPDQRFRTMDELVNALIGVYRGIAGPGMSTYMEAFPVHSAGHPAQPTPPPMGSVGHMGQMAPGVPTPVGMVGASSKSGLYDPSDSVALPKKSKVGLVIAILVVLAAGGGIATFLILSKKGDALKAAGPGSAAVAIADKGSATVVVTPIDTGSAARSGSAAKDPWDRGSADTGSAAPPPPPANDQVPVAIFTQPDVPFEVWENGAKVQDGSDDVMVAKGSVRHLSLRAKGFKDKQITVDSTKKKLAVKLERVAGVAHPVLPVQPPGHKDCTNAIVDPRDARCRKQYCAAHENDPNCELE
jgi:serine/threonine-protein kinase